MGIFEIALIIAMSSVILAFLVFSYDLYQNYFDSKDECINCLKNRLKNTIVEPEIITLKTKFKRNFFPRKRKYLKCK